MKETVGEIEISPAISLLAYVTTFSRQFYFGRSYFFSHFQSNYFDTTVTFSGQLFFQNNWCFLLFQNSDFFAGIIFSDWLLFQSENSTEQTLLENRKFFTEVNFRNSSFFSEDMFRIKISKKELLFKAGTSAQHQPFQKSYILGKSELS